jgi:hypothetical protein
MKRRDFIRSAAVGGSLFGAGMLSDARDASAASASEGQEKKTIKKGLVVYASRTNNTTKVAERFKSTLERNGWQCDSFKILQDSDPTAFPYKINGGDFMRNDRAKIIREL